MKEQAVKQNEPSSTEVLVAGIVNKWVNSRLHNSVVSQNTAAMNLVNEAKPELIAELVEAFDNRKEQQS